MRRRCKITVIFSSCWHYPDINGIHKDPNFWSNPEVFDPDRFLPERIRNRHPYSYIPFSAGLCQRYAMQMKMMVASLIHHFYLESFDYIKDIRLQIDLVRRLCSFRFVPVLQN
ncbi:Cytochrome P450 4g1 [Trachymyrmex septentrionalis]|uniref:Cytochrome P450 4g1 n=1 Tax=Trachymyrmex septentrionalis TaxID=34720 RepID=A0A195FPE2_9HYME|nr:Cytochrome P450 4g1 [Trachymyrmex septentrionalis]